MANLLAQQNHQSLNLTPNESVCSSSSTKICIVRPQSQVTDSRSAKSDQNIALERLHSASRRSTYLKDYEIFCIET